MKSLLEFAVEIKDMYLTEGKSLREIAKRFNTYSLAIYRLLVHLGVPIRDKSDAAKSALANGKSIHPTKGRVMSDETKAKIGAKVSTAWSKMPEDKKEQISKKHQEIWESKTPEEREEFNKKAHVAIAESAIKGSQLERWLLGQIIAAGYDCTAHTKILQNHNLEVDFCFPTLKIAVELDGPGHFSPIWGEDAFAKTKKADNEKNGLLALNGYKVIRIVYTKKHVSKILQERTLKELLDKVEEAEKSNEMLHIIHI